MPGRKNLGYVSMNDCNSRRETYQHSSFRCLLVNSIHRNRSKSRSLAKSSRQSRMCLCHIGFGMHWLDRRKVSSVLNEYMEVAHLKILARCRCCCGQRGKRKSEINMQSHSHVHLCEQSVFEDIVRHFDVGGIQETAHKKLSPSK